MAKKKSAQAISFFAGRRSAKIDNANNRTINIPGGVNKDCIRFTTKKISSCAVQTTYLLDSSIPIKYVSRKFACLRNTHENGKIFSQVDGEI